MVLIELKLESKRSETLRAYHTIAKIFKCRTRQIDNRVAAFALIHRIPHKLAFQEYLELAEDLDATRYMQEQGKQEQWLTRRKQS